MHFQIAQWELLVLCCGHLARVGKPKREGRDDLDNLAEYLKSLGVVQGEEFCHLYQRLASLGVWTSSLGSHFSYQGQTQV